MAATCLSALNNPKCTVRHTTRYIGMHEQRKVHWKREHQEFLWLKRSHYHSYGYIKTEARKNVGTKIMYVRCTAGQEPFNGKEGQKNVWMQKPMGGLLNSPIKFLRQASSYVLKVTLSLMILLGLGVTGAPTFLSSRFGLRTAIVLANKLIPGYAEVQTVKLGWKRPIVVEGVSLRGTDGTLVLSISKIETKASLWSIVRGKAGLGDCTIASPKVDLQQENTSGLLKILLALAPASRLMRSQRQSEVSVRDRTRVVPIADIALNATVKARSGGLRIIDGKLIVEDMVAAAFGYRAFVDVLLGDLAIEEEDDMKMSLHMKEGSIPVKANMWSDGTQAEAVGFLNLTGQRFDLMRAIKLEMDLSPAIAQLYLARINPLLGELVGPAVQDEDMPDIILNVFPEHLVLPAEHFKVDVEPMKAVLARGPLAGGLLALLSKGKDDIAYGKKEVNVRTSHIIAHVDMNGSLQCSRIDFLIAEKIALSTWGTVDWIDETVQMTMAIPSSTLNNLFGFDSLTSGYYLKIPVSGTFARPQVDWKAAAIGIAQLSLKKRGNKFFNDFLALFDKDESIPKPIEDVSWITKS